MAASPAGSSSSRAACAGTSEVHAGSDGSSRQVASANSAGSNDDAPPTELSTTGSQCPTSERISTCSPPMPVTGRASSHAAGPPKRSCTACAAASSAAAGSSTPFGAPVDPLVASTTATSASTTAA